MNKLRMNHGLRNWLVALLVLLPVGLPFYVGCQPSDQFELELIYLDSETVRIDEANDIALLTNDLDRLAEVRIVWLEPAASVVEILAEINKLTKVTTVYCSYFGPDANATTSLLEMPSIEELSFYGCSISDEATEILANDQKLKKLTFSCVTVSPEMVSRIKTARPNLDFQQEETPVR